MNKTEHNKKALLEALEKSLGIVTTACKQVGIGRTTYYEYLKDKDFKKEVDSVQDIALDFAESQLHKQIQAGNTAATIFLLKTKGKGRGFVERQEITGAEGLPNDIKIKIIKSGDRD
jgi:cell division protein FtsI/penicillin-binding protein 2